MVVLAFLTLLGCGRIGFDRDAGAGQSADGGRSADASAAEIDASELETILCCGACTCTEPVCRFECTCGACEMLCPYGSTCMASCASGTCALDCALGSVCALECGPSNLCAPSGAGPTWIGCNDGRCSR